MRALLFSAIGLSALAYLGPQPDPAKLDDATIVAIFDAANTYDIETSQLAVEKSQSREVRDLARQFLSDHKAVRQQGRDLAKRLSLTPTPPKDLDLAMAHAKAIKELRSKSGADFDKAYLAHEVAFHQAVLDAVTGTLLPAIENPELKEFVLKVGPAFHGHHQAAKQLQKLIA